MASLENTVLLWEAAFAAAKTRTGPRLQVRDELAARFPHTSRRELMAACAAARELEKVCYDIGDKCRAELLTREAAEASLAARFPGFSRETYADAVSYGLFISR